MTDIKHIRNFSIIAHIDHGKSTLADRFIQLCGGLEDREMQAQVLDSMDLERERGITIKAHSVTLYHTAKDGNRYQLNFIDTPGHVDFSYEVSRSLAACEGALLVVDAAQGVEAQSVANCYTAIEQGLEVLPVLNKIDLPQVEPERVQHEIEEIIGIDASEACRVSAKTGLGVPDLLEELIVKIPAPEGDRDAPLQALIIDSWFDNYLGVVSLVRVRHGRIKKGDRMLVKSTGQSHYVTSVGVFNPKHTETAGLEAGEVGFVIAGIKDIFGAPVGDTITHHATPDVEILPGFKTVKPQVYAGVFPVDSSDFEAFREALQKLKLNDSALFFEPESSDALGFGFRCGFLGLLHMEIVRERLEREAGLNLISTAPNVVYEVTLEDGKHITVTNPSEFPNGKIMEVQEPIVKATILAPSEYIGTIMELCQDRRGTLLGMDYLSEDRVEIRYDLPLAEIVFDFFDQLKSRTKGYASLDYEDKGNLPGNLVKVDILLNAETVDAFSAIVHRDKAYAYGVMMTGKLRELIPRQQFEVPIQAAIGAKIIARENIRAIRKDVLAKCYGGDITRKRKLLEKQKEGKKRMKMVGRVEVPQEAFVAALATDADIEKVKAARDK